MILHNKVILADNWPLNNLGLGGPVWSAPSVSPGRSVRETDVVRPGNTLVLGDTVPWDVSFSGNDASPIFERTLYYFSWWSLYPIVTVNGWKPDLVGPNPDPPNAWARAGIQKRHGGRWNVLFCDQHIENLTTKALFDVSQDSIAQRWNIDQLPHNY